MPSSIRCYVCLSPRRRRRRREYIIIIIITIVMASLRAPITARSTRASCRDFLIDGGFTTK